MRNLLLLLLCLTALANPTFADGPPLSVFAALRLVSDYRFNGASNSDGNPALQGYVHLIHPRGWYGGAFASSVDFNDPGKTRGELDIYVGRALRDGAMEYRAELMYLAFDETVPGPTYDFWQGKVLARRYIASHWMEFSITHTPRGPYAGGAQSQFRIETQYTFNPRLRATGLVGYGLNRERSDRRYGGLGFEWDWRKFTFGAQWVTTDQRRNECLGQDWCQPTWVGSITLRSW